MEAPRRWYEGLPAVTGEIDCGGEEHRITWRRGKLVLEDHDVLAERSLAALGSKPPTCLEVLDAWRGTRGSEHFHEFLLRESTLSREELARRRASYSLHEESARELPRHLEELKNHPQAAQLRSRVERSASQRLRLERRLWSLTLLEALPAALRRALALSMLVNLERRWHDPPFRDENKRFVESALTAIVLPLFEQSAQMWRRNFKPYAACVAETWLLAPGEEPTCAAWADSRGAHAVLSLPLSWFIDVWARGIALVDDCLVLGVDERSRGGAELRVVALRWERQARETSRSVEAPACVTRATDGDWRLHWL